MKKWIKKWRKHLVIPTDVKSFNVAKKIINEEYYTGFLDAKKLAVGKEEADPYLIAFCQVYGYTLITDENKHRPNKIPAIAQKNGVRCIDINDFLIERGLKMERRK